MITNPIFIIGTERSGSNLLRLILNTHPNISIPHPPHVMRDFSSFIKSYGNLENDKNLMNLCVDISKFVNHHFSPWPFIVKPQDVMAKMPTRTLYGAYVALYEMHLERDHKKRWGCKSTFMHQNINEILFHHKKPFFIHLVRDPRDVSVSAKNSIFSKYHPLNVAKLWKEEQENIERYSSLKKEGRMLTVRYEDLVVHTEKVVKEIMSFLNEEFFPEQLNYYQTDSAKNLAKLSDSWKQVERPVSKKSVGQFRNKLSPKEIAWIEAHCEVLMKKYDYSLDFADKKEPIRFLDNVAVYALEKWKFIQTEINSIKTDDNFKMRWRKKILLNLFRTKQIFSWR